MKHYSYRAANHQGDIVAGQLMALNEADLDNQLHQIDLQLLTNAAGRSAAH